VLTESAARRYDRTDHLIKLLKCNGTVIALDKQSQASDRRRLYWQLYNTDYINKKIH